MIFPSAWLQRLSIHKTEKPKSPWGGGGGDDDGAPRNPWAVPPGGNRGRGNKPTALDEFMRRARGAGGGGGGGGGFGGLPRGLGGRSIWLIGLALIIGLWVAFTSIHPIAPQQRGVVAYFGRYAGTLDPGIQFTLPAPIATVTRVDVQAIRTEDFPAEAGENLMLTGDQNIIDLAYSVRWDIKDPQNYIYQIKDPQETVRAIAESAMRAVIATVTLDEAIGAGRTGIEQRVQELMQSILDNYRAGVRVQGIAIKQADPPAGVIDDFKKVTAAQQEAQSNLNQANTYAQQILARSQGEAAQFDKVYDQYRLAPEVTRRRMYYETMEAVLAKTNKTIVEAPGVVPYLPLPAQRGKVIPPETAAAASAQGGGAMNMTMLRNPVTLGIAVLVLLILAASTFVIVPETEQAVILRFEVPVRTVNAWRPNEPFGATGAGPIARIPFFDKIVWVDKRVLDVDLDNQQVLSTDQLRLEVDAFARFRVVDALKMVNTARSEENVIEQLRPLLGSALRNELGKRQFAALLSPERGQVMSNIRAGLQTLASQYGVQIVDVRIKHADLPSGSPLESSLNRMRTARQQQAATIRAQGQKQAQIIRAGAEATASRIYAESFNRDPDFYDFYRAMQSYRITFGADGTTPDGETSIILSPNNEYLKQFMGRNR